MKVWRSIAILIETMNNSSSLESDIQRVVADLKRELTSVRTNRPSAGLVEDIRVNAYDQMTPLKHLSSVSIVLPREISIQVWDQGLVQSVAKAVESSSLGLSPQVQGNVVRVYLPELSEERRQEFVKHIKKLAEERRIQIRHLRDDARREVEHDEEFTEDDKFSEKERIQKVVEKANKEIEDALESKIKEIEI